MIQESINQLLTTAGVAVRLAPGYEKRIEAKEILGKAKSAQAGLQAIESGLKEPGKKLSATEMKDIESRTSELNRNLYTAKIRSKEGDPLSPYLKKGVEDLPHQKGIRKTLSGIEGNLRARKIAMERMKSKGDAAIDQDAEFNKFRQSVLSGKHDASLSRRV